jgi:uncharacterized protein
MPNVEYLILKTGVVLGRRGGMIAQLYWPFFLGLGGPVSSGQQHFPWIHVRDLARLFQFSIENDQITGVLNGVAPQIITNKEFAQAFGRSLWKPALIPLPAFVFEKMFGAERAKMVLEGQKVIPKRTLSYGFEYHFPDIYSACKEFAPLIYLDDFSS